MKILATSQSYCHFIFVIKHSHSLLADGTVVKNRLPMLELKVRSLGLKMPWRGKWQPTPIFLPGKSHGQRSLVGYCP